MSDGAGVSGGRKTGPSDAAIRAVGEAVHGFACGCIRPWPTTVPYQELAEQAASAAHDPALGEERSVRLGAVLDALRDYDGPSAVAGTAYARACADFLLRSFTGDST